MTNEGGTKVNIEKSLVECVTGKKVTVDSAVVINDNTDHIFELQLVAKKKNTKLIKGRLLSAPNGNSKQNIKERIHVYFLDIALASRSIQNQGPPEGIIIL